MFREKASGLQDMWLSVKWKRKMKPILVFGKANLIFSYKIHPVYMLRGICKNYCAHHSAANNRANEKLKISTENWRREDIWRETVLLGFFLRWPLGVGGNCEHFTVLCIMPVKFSRVLNWGVLRLTMLMPLSAERCVWELLIVDYSQIKGLQVYSLMAVWC